MSVKTLWNVSKKKGGGLGWQPFLMGNFHVKFNKNLNLILNSQYTNISLLVFRRFVVIFSSPQWKWWSRKRKILLVFHFFLMWLAPIWGQGFPKAYLYIMRSIVYLMICQGPFQPYNYETMKGLPEMSGNTRHKIFCIYVYYPLKNKIPSLWLYIDFSCITIFYFRLWDCALAVCSLLINNKNILVAKLWQIGTCTHWVDIKK